MRPRAQIAFLLLGGLALFPLLAEAVNWKDGQDWAFACDFPGNDLSNAKVPAERCGPVCQGTHLCTHFSWTDFEGGTCWMKTGAVSRADAVDLAHGGAVCGVVGTGSARRLKILVG